MNSRHLLGAISAALVLTLVACQPPASAPDSVRLAVRLVDGEHRTGIRYLPDDLEISVDPKSQGLDDTTRPESTRRFPTATIDDDTRFVLAGYESRVLAHGQPVSVVQSGELAFDADLGGHFQGARSLLVSTRVGRNQHWQRLPARRIEIERSGDADRLLLRYQSPSFHVGLSLDLFARALRPPSAADTLYETAKLEIPPGATLEFSLGLLRASQPGARVEFAISACEGELCAPLFQQTVTSKASAEGGGGAAWLDRRISLEHIAGKRGSLRFETHSATASDLAFPVWGNPVIIAPADNPAPPSFVLISIDTLRADHLSLYGYGRKTSPFMEGELAQQATVFETAIAAATTTGPAHMAMFTSLPPLVHGATVGLTSLRVPLPTLPELLRARGYATAAFTENGPLARKRGFGLGFDEYTENKSPRILVPTGHVQDTFAQGRRWLEDQRGRPSFVFLHTFQVHGPHVPPEPYHEYFSAEVTSEATRPIRDAKALAYDREIRYVDDELRALFSWMQSKLPGNTFFIVLSDHGEEFLEHGGFGHSSLPHEELLRVPFIVAGPGVATGRRVRARVTHFDVMPTILKLAGIESPPYLRGRDLSPWLFGEADAGTGADDEILVSESWSLPMNLPPPALGVRRGDRKLIRFRDAAGKAMYRYFDLSRDPGEQRDLWPRRAHEAEDLRAAADAYHANAEAMRRQLGGGAEVSREAILDPEREAKLRALGYIE